VIRDVTPHLRHVHRGARMLVVAAVIVLDNAGGDSGAK